MRVAIIGAGIMGCATARALARRGVDVVLLERAIPGAEASSAAAGILGAQLEMHEKGVLLESFVRARREYATFAAELKEETGIDVGYRVSGALCTARTDEEHAALVHAVTWQRAASLRAELLNGDAARALEPSLAKEIVSAAHYPDESQVDPPSLLRALVASLRGVEVRSGATVQRILVEGDRCVGVALDDGEVRADATVLAAGSWASLVPGLPASVPTVRPARGQIVQLDERPPRLRAIVLAGHTYAVPRGDGRVLCGSTVEMVGFRKEVTAAGVHAILDGVLRTLPTLASAPLTATWSSFRPHTDGAPLVGASQLAGLFLATGHFRNGILLANETARAVADAVTASA
jgi:glycine oxidase